MRAVAKNGENGQDVMALLLNKHRDKIQITQDVVKAAARNKQSGQEIMALLLDKRRDLVQITQDVVRAAAGSGRHKAMALRCFLRGSCWLAFSRPAKCIRTDTTAHSTAVLILDLLL
ncbi:and ankyrin domain protein [Colletotrichum incanum]|uniref:And ankyrin domain protein n=1 Tax=Colletotrichum incanum TaxID=1573173 RepID=A0A161YE01_COLIC|nr:and ankyrin domain protein [Colletotrichum incanum]